MGLEGHVALVTGGTRGLGRGIALALAGQGARVAVTYRTPAPALTETLTALRDAGADGMAVAGDVRSREQVRTMVEQVTHRLGAVDILVNNAGIGPLHDLVDLPDDEWDAIIATNLTGALSCAQAVLPAMIAARWGRIINITSTASVRTIRKMGAYSISKAGLAMLTQSLAVEVGRHGITVNAVAPSTVPTEINADALRQPGILEAELAANPMGRIGTVGDIGAAVAFLASDGAGWINGHSLIVDGGLTAITPEPVYG